MSDIAKYSFKISEIKNLPIVHCRQCGTSQNAYSLTCVWPERFGKSNDELVKERRCIYCQKMEKRTDESAKSGMRWHGMKNGEMIKQ